MCDFISYLFLKFEFAENSHVGSPCKISTQCLCIIHFGSTTEYISRLFEFCKSPEIKTFPAKNQKIKKPAVFYIKTIEDQRDDTTRNELHDGIH